MEIDTHLSVKNLSELFTYIGEFKIVSTTGKNLESEDILLSPNSVVDIAEEIKINAEDITVKSEDLKTSYIHGRRFNKTAVVKKTYENLHTNMTEKTLYLNDEIYDGSFHMHINGTVMTGRQHSGKSLMLVIR